MLEIQLSQWGAGLTEIKSDSTFMLSLSSGLGRAWQYNISFGIVLEAERLFVEIHVEKKDSKPASRNGMYGHHRSKDYFSLLGDL